MYSKQDGLEGVTKTGGAGPTVAEKDNKVPYEQRSWGWI